MFFRKKLDLEQALYEIKNIKETAEEKDTLQDIEDRYVAIRDACIKALTLYIKWPQFPKHQREAINLINQLCGTTDKEVLSTIIKGAKDSLSSAFQEFHSEEYSSITMVTTKPNSRQEIKDGTIELLKDTKKLTAYWIEHGSVQQRALSIGQLKAIIERLPAVGYHSNSPDLITDVCFKYGCGLDGNRPPGRYFQIVTAAYNKILHLSPLHYEKYKIRQLGC